MPLGLQKEELMRQKNEVKGSNLRFNSAGAGRSGMVYVVSREVPTNTQKYEQEAPLNIPKHAAPAY